MKSIKMLVMAAFSILSVSVVAQDTTKHKMNMAKQPSEKMKYSCPMHPEVSSDKPGKCSKCGMDLVLSKKEHMKMGAMKMYSCPMHPEVTSDKPGKCSKCGMELVKSDKEKMKMESMKMYTCPMHPEVTSDKPGKCTKCGMALVEKKEDHSKHQH
jgi:Cu(I)/Ag(I) efflux system membrane fusion protein